MAFFGRQSQADRRRAEAFKRWLDARTPFALPSAALGALAIVDCWTMVIGVIAGVAAVIMGLRGLAEIRAKPQLLGGRLCRAGIGTGIAGLLLSIAALIVFHRPGSG